MAEQLPLLHFVVDELLMEGHRDADGDPKRIHDLQRMLTAHAAQGSDFAEHTDRLLSAYDELAPDAQRAVAAALVALCLHAADLRLARRLGERPAHRATIMRAVTRQTVPQSAEWLELFLDWARPGDLAAGEALCICAGRLAKWGADVQPLVPWLFEALSTKGHGRGQARIDVGRQAAVALGTMARGDAGSGIAERLRERADESRTVAANVRVALAILAGQ